MHERDDTAAETREGLRVEDEGNTEWQASGLLLLDTRARAVVVLRAQQTLSPSPDD